MDKKIVAIGIGNAGIKAIRGLDIKTVALGMRDDQFKDTDADVVINFRPPYCGLDGGVRRGRMAAEMAFLPPKLSDSE